MHIDRAGPRFERRNHAHQTRELKEQRELISLPFNDTNFQYLGSCNNTLDSRKELQSNMFSAIESKHANEPYTCRIVASYMRVCD